MNIPPKLKEYLDEARAPLPAISDPDQPLQIDSLTLIRLVAFMESDLGIRIEDEELLAENFATLRALDALMASKSQVGGEI
jgi:acyl carrier protein